MLADTPDILARGCHEDATGKTASVEFQPHRTHAHRARRDEIERHQLCDAAAKSRDVCSLSWCSVSSFQSNMYRSVNRRDDVRRASRHSWELQYASIANFRDYSKSDTTSRAALRCENIRISTGMLWRVLHILTEPVTYTFLSVNRRNNEARRGYTDIFTAYLLRSDETIVFAHNYTIYSAT